jgi:PD-(D/E)XK endonuclease
MKDKSGVTVLGLAAKPKSPVAHTAGQVGELAELAFHHRARDMGFGVTKPYGNDESYDFVVDSGNRLWRVQVKSSSRFYHGAYRVMARRFRRPPEPRPAYTDKQIDILAAYILPARAWYIIPVHAFSPQTSLMFYPHKPGHSGKYERFREAWFLMACRRDGELREGIVTSPACTYSPSSGSPCPGCPYKKK